MLTRLEEGGGDRLWDKGNIRDSTGTWGKQSPWLIRKELTFFYIKNRKFVWEGGR